MDDREPEPAVTVVALVASAGGLDAFTAVLRGLPLDLPVTVLVQQHLSGNVRALVEILRRRIPQPVSWADDGGHLTRGTVLVCPPRHRFEVFPDGTYTLVPAVNIGYEYPHDATMRSLADAYGSGVLAVVLTGMGRDGAAGTVALKAAGGIVLAQSADTAEQPGMPKAAAEAGADLVLPLHEIGGVVAEVVRGGPVPHAHDEIEAVREIFGGGSIMEGIARGVDWSRTPLGPVHSWGPTLRTVVRLVMAAPQPLQLLWGDEHVIIYNDGNIEQGGAKHPQHFARSHFEMWPEARSLVEPLYRRVMRGESVHQQNQRWLLDRRGRLEYAWFDNSLGPVRDEHGDVVAILQASYERTAEVLAARRLETLNQLAATPTSRSQREALLKALAVLDEAPDVAFAAAYLLDMSGTRAALIGAAGLEEGSAAAPRSLRLAPGASWPLLRVVHEHRPVLLEDVGARFPGYLVGPERLAPECAVLHPLREEAEEKVVGVLVLGVHPRLSLDARYREFLAVAGETISAKASDSHARQRERLRMDRLAELDRAKTEFFSNVSHEFRTPLTLILGPLEQLLRQSGDPIEAGRGDVELAVRNARRLLRLVGTLLEFSQTEAGQRLRARSAPVDLAQLTRQIASQFRSAAEGAGLDLVVTTPPLPEPVWVDAEMWEKIVSNLVSNALKFTWRGLVEVTLQALPNHVQLVVRDTGVGIPSGDLPFVFKRFHRIRETQGRTHEGAGIGLALVDELVRRHHGRMRVTSEEGAGSTFTVWLPLGQPHAPDETPFERPPVGEIAAAMAAEAALWDPAREQAHTSPGLDDDTPLEPAGGAQVLIVDDNADMRGYLIRLLGKTWRVAEARDGEEAFQLARREPPELILADVMLPGMDGFTLLRKVRAHQALAQTSFILVTARGSDENTVEGMIGGADDYIVKPFSARELLARVGAQLELSRVRHAAALAVRAGQEHLRRLLETDNVGVLFFDRTGTLVEANDVFLRMSGYSRDELDRGELTWRRMTPREWMAVSEDQMEGCDVTGRIGPYEKEYFCKDGSRKWMLFTGRDIGDGMMSEFCVDITDLKLHAPSSPPQGQAAEERGKRA